MGTKLIQKFLMVMLGVGSLTASAVAAEPVVQFDFVSGKVMVNFGEGFRSVRKSGILNVGDQLLISRQGHVKLFYASANCSVDYNGAALVTISADVPCEAGLNQAKFGTVLIQPANAMVGGGLTTPVAVGLSVEAAVLLTAGYLSLKATN